MIEPSVYGGDAPYVKLLSPPVILIADKQAGFRQGRTWTGLPVEESIRMTEGRDRWRKYVHGVANPQIEDG